MDSSPITAVGMILKETHFQPVASLAQEKPVVQRVATWDGDIPFFALERYV